jgi:hypothetical protein
MPLNPSLQLTLYKPAQAIGNSPLARIAAVQVDQRSPRAAVAHPVHQLTQRGPSRSRERVSSVAEIVEMNFGQASFGQRETPHPAPEVAVPQWCAHWAGDTSASGWLAVTVAR